MSSLNIFFAYAIVFFLLSYALGLIVYRDPGKAWKIIQREAALAKRIGLWLLKHMFLGLAELFQALARACGHKKKRSP
ncbi:hypothetical protein KGP36_05095 [Patescibacteria group bacterium]|nr:hypothetical protein [Patescibacteria group bacterium]